MISTRGIVCVGTACNLNCKHCYYYNTKRYWKNIFVVMAHILLIRLCRMDKIDFTGGEATIHPLISFLVWYCERLGFKEVRLVTNGTHPKKMKELTRFKSIRFAMSVHGSRRGDIEKLFGRDVSTEHSVAFDYVGSKITYVICVVTPMISNMETVVSDIARKFPGVRICIKCLDYNWEHAITNWKIGDYRDGLNESIRRALKDFPNLYIDLKFWPMCSFDRDIRENPRARNSSYYANAYDENDWNPVINKRTPVKDMLAFIFGDVHDRKRLSLLYGEIEGEYNCEKRASCSGCKYQIDCDGPFRGYVSKFGFSEFSPVDKHLIAIGEGRDLTGGYAYKK